MSGTEKEKISLEGEWNVSIAQLLFSTGFLPSNVATRSDANLQTLIQWLETTESKLVLKELANWIASEWNLDFPSKERKENLVESLVRFYRYLNIRIPVSLLSRKSFQCTVYRSILEEVAGIMITMRQLKEKPWLTQDEEVLFSSALETSGNMNIFSESSQDFCSEGDESTKVTALRLRTELKSVLDILESYSTSKGAHVSFEEMQDNINKLVTSAQDENELLDADCPNENLRGAGVLRDRFIRIHEILQDMVENRQQLDALDEWKHSIPKLDLDFGKKIQKMVALLKPAIEVLQGNERWNRFCSEIVQDGKRLEIMERQFKLCESLLLRIENSEKDVEHVSQEEHKENLVSN